MSSNKQRNNYANTSPTSRTLSPGSTDQVYVNLNSTPIPKRPSYGADSSRNSNASSVQPLTVNNVHKLYPPDKRKSSKGWYSPPSSVQSDSRTASIAGAKHYTPKSPSKLQTIDEHSVSLPIEKVIQLCEHRDEDIRANALAFLQHLTYNNNDKKLEVRNCKGIQIILESTRSNNPAVVNAALGVLKNMSYTELEMIISEIERLGGIQRILKIIEEDNNSETVIYQKEMAVDILWNLSVHYDLKNIILTETIGSLVQWIIIPESRLNKQREGHYEYSEEEIDWSPLLRNTLGIIRNISYESKEARFKLRDEDGLVDSILHLICMAKVTADVEDDEDLTSLINSKIIENCTCILRNLTYAIQETVDPCYLQNRENYSPKPQGKGQGSKSKPISVPEKENPKGAELLLCSKRIVAALIPILKYGANAITLEAAAGIIQNVSAGDWDPSKEMQVQFRLQMALPYLVELIDLGTDDVIRSAATALRNLVREEYTCMLIGTNGLNVLTDKIPYHSKSKKISGVAVAAVLSTIFAIIKNQEEFMKEFITLKGTERCIYVRDSKEFIIPDSDYPDKVEQFSKHILQLLWKTSSTKEILKKNNFKQSDILTSKTTDSSSTVSYQPNKPSNQDTTDDRNSMTSETGNRFSNTKYSRESCSTIVSNPALQKRNSRAYTTSTVKGYGEVRVPTKQQKNHTAPRGYLQPTSEYRQNKPNDHYSRPYQSKLNPSRDNHYTSPQIKGAGYKNGGYASSDYEPSEVSNNFRSPPSIRHEDPEIDHQMEIYNREYATVKGKQKNGDSWV